MTSISITFYESSDVLFQDTLSNIKDKLLVYYLSRGSVMKGRPGRPLQVLFFRQNIPWKIWNTVLSHIMGDVKKAPSLG